MAAYTKHVMSKNSANKLFTEKLNLVQFKYRGYAKKHYKQKIFKVEVPECRKLKSTQDSLSTKGFLRCHKPYQPTEDVESSLKNIVNSVIGSDDFQSATDSQRYRILCTCFRKFNHCVPNSILHQIVTYDDLKNYYTTPVDVTLPLERMKRENLPPNLHIEYEPHRFHPDEDTMFNGQTAFPKSNTLVTGLRSRRKFKGCTVSSPWEQY